VAVSPHWINECYTEKKQLPAEPCVRLPWMPSSHWIEAYVSAALVDLQTYWRRYFVDGGKSDTDEADASDGAASAGTVGGILNLPKILKGVHVFFYKMGATEQRRLTRLAIGYGGCGRPALLAWRECVATKGRWTPTVFGVNSIGPWTRTCRTIRRTLSPTEAGIPTLTVHSGTTPTSSSCGRPGWTRVTVSSGKWIPRRLRSCRPTS